MEKGNTPTPDPPEVEKEASGSSDNAEPEEQWSFVTTCKVCDGDLTSREPKLMPCLHTVCKECVMNVASADKQSCRCPICRQDCRNVNDIIDNYFLTSAAASASSENNIKNPSVCLCDDKSEVSAFCQDCMEWLCDPCVQAHQRVRVTKDHVIKEKSEVASTSGESNGGRTEQKPLFCAVHLQEQLKLYCETCEKLTCRDCQLQEHKEHKYQFIGEIAVRQKSALRILLGKLNEKQNYVQQTKKHILSKGEELQNKEQRATQEIRNLVFRLVNDITQRGKKLLSDLKGACDARRKMFDQQILEVHRVEQAIEHSADFTKRALHSENITALLYSQKVIVHQLVFLLRIMCTRQPIAGLDIKFLTNMQHMPNFSQLWTLMIHDPLQAASSGQPPQASAHTGSRPQGQIPTHPSSGPVPHGLLVGGPMRGPGNRLPSPGQELQQKINLHQLMSRRQNSAEGSPHSPQNRLIDPSHSPGFQPGLTPMSGPQRIHLPPAYRPVFPRQATSPAVPTMIYRAGPVQQKYNFPPANLSIGQMSKQMLSQVGINTSETIPNIPPIIPPRPSSNQSQTGLSRSNTPSSPLLVSPASSGDETIQGNGPRIKDESVTSMGERASCSVVEGQQQRANTFSPQSVSSGSSQADVSQAGTTNNNNDQPNTSRSSPAISKGEGDRSSCMMGSNGPLNVKQEPGLEESHSLQPSSSETHENGKHMSPRTHSNSDPNEDWCAVCHNGGDLLCCDSCPRVYHLYCHVPALTSTPSDSWVCTLCQVPDDGTNRSVSPSGTSRKRRISSALPEKEKMLCEKVLLEIYCSEDSIPFQDPVSRSVPNYHKIIQHPMELGTIRSRLQTSHFNHYQTVLEFIDDFKLMIHNCHIYNGEESHIGVTATALNRYFDELIEQHLPQYVSLLGHNEETVARPVRPASEGDDGERRRKRKPDKVYHIAPMHIK
ncbi:E3 ubiquitin-protein ligase TRIM33-like isoform X2 [Asterias rubens]|uniref:E3 ubiquitin-protein ligase TRIM33-like isoform X2 n=1 Tax=Asterias rubens TaxID=7604 RepID=UPI0014554C87|nr:E3 ubiquitin-protein ligase TRIM33-like isoform X2 [Asterias rubens]